MLTLEQQNKVGKVIPDNSEAGLIDTMKIAKSGKVASLSLSVEIKHPFVGDLKVNLVSPTGTKKTIHNRNGGKTKDLKKTFSGDELKEFIGEKSKGDWKIQVVDYAPKDSGSLVKWNLKFEIDNCTEKSEITIPDKDPVGLISSQMCKFPGKVKSANVGVNIVHGFVGDLKVSLVSPSGKSVTLHNRAGGNQKNLNKGFSGDVMRPFIGENAKGAWQLQIKDFAPKDSGNLKSWNLDLTIK